MTISQARKLKPVDKVRQKMHGYVMTVKDTKESYAVIGSRRYINIICEAEDGCIMNHNHKEVDLVK